MVYEPVADLRHADTGRLQVVSYVPRNSRGFGA